MFACCLGSLLSTCSASRIVLQRHTCDGHARVSQRNPMTGIERKAHRWPLAKSWILRLFIVLPFSVSASSLRQRRSIGLAQAGPSGNGTSAATNTTVAANTTAATNTSDNSSLQNIIQNGLVDNKISTLYWAEVDRAITAAAFVTPKPHSVNDPGPTPTPDPYSAILDVSTESDPSALGAGTIFGASSDSAAAQGLSGYANYELVTPPPPFPEVKQNPKVGVLPYQMALGAELLYGMSEKVTPQPLPAQEQVDASFASQCPMVMLSNEVFVTPPCNGGDGFGTWTDSLKPRKMLRWAVNGRGGIDFNVDSAVTGPGSVNFATLSEKMTLTKNIFELYSCMNVLRYSIEETVVKVDHMAQAAQSTASDHDLGETSVAVFYQYLIRHANGSLMAQTSQYRLPETDINFTSFVPGSLHSETFAIARRHGRWQGNDWRQCTDPQQGWNISFPTHKSSNLVAIATVQDLQVAAAAVLTLLAWREEKVSPDGFQHAGQGSLYWSLVPPPKIATSVWYPNLPKLPSFRGDRLISGSSFCPCGDQILSARSGWQRLVYALEADLCKKIEHLTLHAS
eukprot:s2730_g2.t1